MDDDFLPATVQSTLREVDGSPVILDADLARFFGVSTSRLNEAVGRKAARFEGYSFLVPMADLPDLISQDAISSGHGGRRKPVRVFTEHGVVMAATVLNSDRAIAASRRIVEGFVAMKRSVAPAAPLNTGFLGRLRERMEALMQAELDAATGKTVQAQTQEFISEGLSNIRARLQRNGLENEEIEARILKLLAEADEARARGNTQHEMTTRQRLKNQANALRLMIEAEQAMSGGEIGVFLAVLADLGRD